MMDFIYILAVWAHIFVVAQIDNANFGSDVTFLNNLASMVTRSVVRDNHLNQGGQLFLIGLLNHR